MANSQDIKDAFLVSCVAEGREIDDQPQLRTIHLAVIPNTPEFLPYLTEAYEFCEAMEKASLPGSGDPNYHLVPGFDKWTFIDDLDYEIPAVYAHLTSCNTDKSWPLDPVMAHLDPTIAMTFRNYTIRYFDEAGKQHFVKPVISFQVV